MPVLVSHPDLDAIVTQIQRLASIRRDLQSVVSTSRSETDSVRMSMEIIQSEISRLHVAYFELADRFRQGQG